jgi:hypothetical protein
MALSLSVWSLFTCRTDCQGSDFANVEPLSYDVESDYDGGLTDVMLDKSFDCLDNEMVEYAN